MKTWQAALAHIGVTALQAVSAADYFSGSGAGALGNMGVQIAAQSALTLLNGWLAVKNSHTDPQGNKLVPAVGGGYTSTGK